MGVSRKPAPAAVIEQPWATRLLWTLVGAALLSWAFEIETGAVQYLWAALLAIVAGIWGLGIVVVSWLPAGATRAARTRGETLAWVTALITVACFCGWSVLQIHGFPAYGTDELAIDQYAARLVQHGMNPYVHSMGPSFPMFRVSPGGYTYTLTGGRVTQLSYPALSFLVYLPFLWLGWTRQLAPGIDVIGWSLAILLMFRLLPRPLRAGALILGGFGAYINLAVIGLTDLAFMPLLVMAAYRWDEFDGRRWRSYLGPVAFGLAMACKQTPWPVLPFILAGLVCDQRPGSLRGGAERAGRYLVAALAAFLVPNLPFILMSPSNWAKGTIAPLANSLVPAGQGGIGFSLFLRIGGGSLFAFTLLSLVVLIVALVTYVGTYPLLKPATFLLPALAYFFAVRSFAVYLIALIPPALVAAASTRDPPVVTSARGPLGWARSREWGVAIAGLGAAAMAIFVYALAAGPPLGVRITHVSTGGGANLAQAVTVRLTNHSGSPVSPAFTMETPSGVTTFWHRTGPRSLAPGATATYTLYSPNTPSQPAVSDGVTVLALTSHPDAVSVSQTYSPPTWHVGFDPESFDQIMPVHRSVVLRVQLLDEWDSPIRRAGVPISVSQTTSGRRGVVSLNGERPGAGTVVATNGRGQAKVIITDVHGSTAPVMLSARPRGATATHTPGASGTLELRFSSVGST